MKKISVLEDRIAVMESHISQVRIVNDKAEQYQRHLCRRIDGINVPPAGQQESSEECLQKAKTIFIELGVEILDDVAEI